MLILQKYIDFLQVSAYSLYLLRCICVEKVKCRSKICRSPLYAGYEKPFVQGISGRSAGIAQGKFQIYLVLALWCEQRGMLIWKSKI